MRKIYQLGAIALIAGLMSGCLPQIAPQPLPSSPSPQVTPAKPAAATKNLNLLLGNPSNAASNTTNSANNYLMVKPQYTMSYNNKTHTANWVSWQLNKSWLGTADRKNDFRPDDSLPAGWYKVRPNDYIGFAELVRKNRVGVASRRHRILMGDSISAKHNFLFSMTCPAIVFDNE